MRIFRGGRRGETGSWPLLVGLLGIGWASGLAAAEPPLAKAEQDADQPAAKAPPPPAAAERHYREDVVTEALGRRRGEILRLLRDGVNSPQEAALFKEYYEKYAFPRWTRSDNYALIAQKFRFELQTELKNAKPGPAYEALLRMVLKTMTGWISDKDLHPVVRYNAMLAIGDLNVNEPEARVVRPLSAACEIMAKALSDQEQIDVVRVAALIGLNRHLRAGAVEPANLAKLGELLLKWATQESPPPGRSREGHAWMRSLAIDSLGMIREPALNRRLAEEVLKIVDQKENPLSVRCSAARALGGLNLQGAGLKPWAVAGLLGRLASDACDAEIHRKLSPSAIEAQRLAALAGMGMGPVSTIRTGRGGLPGTEGEPIVDEAATASRRRLKSQLKAVCVGFGWDPDKPRAAASSGVLGLAAGTAEAATLTALVQQRLGGLMHVLDNEEAMREDLIKQVKEARDLLLKDLQNPAPIRAEAKTAPAAPKPSNP